jgi:negative regulator of sigma E activity
MNEGIKMQISAFVDGELPEAEAQLLVRRLSQDAALRQQAAEYFAIGRALRGQASVAASGDLRGRIAAALDDRLVDQEFDAIEPVTRRYGRPLAGLAIAATVAVAAIFGLQQMTQQNGTVVDTTTPAIAEGAVDGAYTVPEIDYFERHNDFKSEVGNNNFDYRRVSADVDDDAEEIDPPADTDNETEESAE